MATTIFRAVSERALGKAEELLFWANREVIPVLREMRDALNLETVQRFRVNTLATGLFANIWTSDAMPTDSAWLVEAKVIARAISGTAQRCTYIRRGLFYNESGTVTQQGATDATYTNESAAGCDVRLQVSGQTIVLDVQDDGASQFQWVALVRVLSTFEV